MNRKLKARIIEYFGTQWQFARDLNLHEVEVSQVVRGRRMLEPEEQARWAKALKTDPKELFSGELRSA